MKNDRRYEQKNSLTPLLVRAESKERFPAPIYIKLYQNIKKYKSDTQEIIHIIIQIICFIGD